MPLGVQHAADRVQAEEAVLRLTRAGSQPVLGCSKAGLNWFGQTGSSVMPLLCYERREAGTWRQLR